MADFLEGAKAKFPEPKGMKTKTPLLRPPLFYVGGKSRLLPHILPLVQPRPGELEYVEPFGGGAAVLIAKDRHPSEIYNDMNGDVVAFFRVLRDHPDELHRRLSLTPFSREEFAQTLEPAEQGEVEWDEVERARKFFTRLNQCFGGSLEPSRSDRNWTVSRKSSRGINGTVSAHLDKIDRLLPVAQRLMGTAIERDDGLALIRRRDAETTVFFVDPPYIGSEYFYPVAVAPEFHANLASLLKSCKGRVILTYYAHPIVDELYAGWLRTEVKSRATVHGGTSERTEVVLQNRD